MPDTQQAEGGAASARLRGTLRGLELPAPDWIVEIVRPRPAPVLWVDAARAAVVITAPLALGLALGQPALGIIVTMGALPPTIADQGGRCARDCGGARWPDSQVRLGSWPAT